MELVLASRNQGKIREMKAVLAASLPGVTVLSLDDIGFAGEIEETGDTFEENALCKARVPASRGYIGIADDSGLAVDALGGAPGVYSARFAQDEDGIGHDDEKNNRKLLRLLSGVEEEKRGAKYVCAIACVTPSGEEFTVRGEVGGRITEEAAGDGGFGYDPYFFYPPFGKTFAQLTMEEKNGVSHRARALALFAAECGKRFHD